MARAVNPRSIRVAGRKIGAALSQKELYAVATAVQLAAKSRRMRADRPALETAFAKLESQDHCEVSGRVDRVFTSY